MSSHAVDVSEIQRPTQIEPEGLFDVEPEQADYWFGLPQFEMRNAQPQRRLTVNFLTSDDVRDFAQKLGVPLSAAADSLWWPPQQRLEPKAYVWRGTPSPTRYPVYVPSKGRAQINTTGRLLGQAGVTPWWVVEPQEADEYRARYGDRVLILPFSNLGQGSIPARNWIWEHAKAQGHRWHWIIDDNVLGFWRTHANRRLVVEQSSAPLRVVEDLADRYENLAFAGLSADGFAPDRTQLSPIAWNTRVYSVTLINTGLPFRWRGRYNEDTDLCLRALKSGYATALLRAFLMKKAHTARSGGVGGMAGGNTDNVYNTEDHRRAFAESLKEQHPDVVDVVWKFGRWHHEVDYSPFKGNRPRLLPGITPTKHVDEYGLQLVRRSDRPAS